LNKAKYYSVLAGEQAAGRDANATALRHFQQANSLALQLPFYDIDLQWRLAVGMGDVQRKLGDLEEATNALRSAGPLASTGRLLRDRLVDLYWRLGETTQEQGEHDAAINYLATAEQFLGQANNNENAKGLARIRLAQAKAYHRRGDVAAALTASAEAIQAAGEVQALDELCQAYEMHAKLLLRDGKLREAQQDFKSIATLYDQMGFYWGIPDLLDTLGALAIKTGQFDQSQSLFSMALSHFESLGNLYGMGKTMINIGHLNRLRGKLDEAEHWLQSGISTARMLRADYLLARAQGEMAEIQYSRGTYDEMSVTLQDSLARARKIGAHDLLAANFITQARLETARNRFDAARSQAQEGVRMAREMHDSSLEGFGWSIAAEAALKAGDREEARRLLLQAQKSLNNSGNVLATAQVMTVAYQVFLAYGQLAKAKTAFENARAIYQKAGAHLYLQNLVKGK
jgi:tetratricopeptide (TPR) repeat protein